MGFVCTEVQIDIGKYIAHGPKYRMVQAQRGQAKTTITAAYAVWRFIHDPTTRVLILSAGDTQATEIANWVIQIINGMPELECLGPIERTATVHRLKRSTFTTRSRDRRSLHRSRASASRRTCRASERTF
jgi:hypothetical protein